MEGKGKGKENEKEREGNKREGGSVRKSGK